MKNSHSINSRRVDSAYVKFANAIVNSAVNDYARATYLIYLFEFDNNEMCKRARNRRNKLIEIEEYTALTSKKSPTALAIDYWYKVWKRYRADMMCNNIQKLSFVPINTLMEIAEKIAEDSITGKCKEPNQICEEKSRNAKYREQKREYEKIT